MTKSSHSLAAIPPHALAKARELGQRLRAHRIDRGWTIAAAAERLLCSPTTLRALEAGRPGTSIGLLLNALWLLGQVDTLDLVAPAPTGLTANRRVRRAAGKTAKGVISDDERDF